MSMFLFSSCSLDNYDDPNASLSGKILDSETGDLVQTDVINGTTIKLKEHGYDPVTPQYLRVKNDGSYSNSMLFANTYTVQPDQRNFLQIDEQDVDIKGNTNLDFKVTPYLRVNNVNIIKEANTVYATFSIEQLTSDVIKSIALFASDQPIVGSSVYSTAVIKTINAVISPDQTIKIGLNVAKNKVYFSENKDYYFRVGALTSYPGAKYNYASAVKLNIGQFIEEPEPTYYYLDKCESTEDWYAPNLTLDSSDPQEGTFCLKAMVNHDVVLFQKVFKTPVNAHVSKDNGYFAFDLFISDATQINWDGGDSQIEIASGGNCDQQELNWPMRSSLHLHNGWNHLALKLTDANSSGGAINLSSINWLRIYHTSTGTLTMKIDNIRFYEDY